eukprot:TRINITY_DN53055_c0_g1_i1.p1 TRINITY_DN53055_c0_g1~~TRINITY_DN53055_c0_g1_i1.p1  ORF type:complete len:435 (+),score=114.00 TRINITY_DN53055_c0_g1_i1:58-1362(+)
MKRPASPAGHAVVKKAKRVASPGLGFKPPVTKAAFPLDAKVKRTEVTSKSPYLDKRCDKCDGHTVKQCLELMYSNAKGEKVRYMNADLRYDVNAGRLKVIGGGSPAAAAGRSSSPSGSQRKGPPLRAVRTTAAAASLADGVKLPSGSIMPAVGFGTYKLKDSEVAGPVTAALKAGYRLIDTAQVYENEKGIGQALCKSGLGRGDVYIETKVWRSSHGYDRTMKACHQSLRKLGVEYIDLYVIHWPGCKEGWPLPKGTKCPKDWTPAMRDTGTWRAMEDLYEQGKVKAIGVTNYSIRHLKQLLKSCRIKPMVNQVEFHPRLVQTELLDFCKKHGIAVQAYASLGSGDAAQAESFFSFKPVQDAAKAHKVTAAQVLLKWALQKGCHIVPKSVKPERVKENAQLFKFTLSSSEMKAIDKLNTGTRYAWKGLDPDTVK